MRMKSESGKPNVKIKRVMDLAICILALPLVLPLGGLLALLIYCSCGQSPFYCHKRIGKNGDSFTIYKFRTMVRDADALLCRYLQENPQYANEWLTTRKLQQDPRLTRIGIFLRKTSLDELPQILNILQGSMTLVGPRPIVDEECDRYGEYFVEYCQSSPGLTGLWQISGRNNTSYQQRVELDHFYLNNWSIWLDLRILFKTIPAVIGGKGAY